MNGTPGLINVTDRRKIELTGVMSLDSFDEYSVTVTVSCGKLMVEGDSLNITVLDLERGVVCAQGTINAVAYTDIGTEDKQGFFSRLFGGRKK